MVARKLPKVKVVKVSPALGIRVPNVDMLIKVTSCITIMLIKVTSCICARVLHWF